MDIKNTEYSLLNRVSTRKEQHRDECPNKTRKLDHFKREKNISKRIISRTSKDSRISFSNEYRLSIKEKRRMKIQRKTHY